MLVLQTLVFGPRHGHGIVVAIQQGSQDSLLVDHGSLYPALQRLEQATLIVSEWGVSDNNRKAKFYTLTPRGRQELRAEASTWRQYAAAIFAVLESA